MLDDDKGPTDSASITCNMDCPVMVISVYAHKLTEPSRSPKFAELADKANRVFCQTNDSPINVDNKGVWSVYFGACRKADVCIKNVNEKQNSFSPVFHLQHLTCAQFG